MAKEYYTYRICSAVTPFEGELINVCNVYVVVNFLSQVIFIFLLFELH